MPPAKKNADEAQEDLLNSLLMGLQDASVSGESPRETLSRLIQSTDSLKRILGTGHARVLVVEHLGPAHTTFDTGGQYAVRWVSAEDGTVSAVFPVQELGANAKPTHSMAWHVANDHLTDRIDRWLKPEAYR
jgi:hypothetical protein